MPTPLHDDIKRKVSETYGKVATSGMSGCGCSCSPSRDYNQTDLDSVPKGADLGLGSGNPLAIADIQAGETVMDLGSGGGIDCFLAANAVGDDGLVIGIDMTPEMVSRARANAREGGYSNVDFRLGEIENLPVADSSVDVIMSNCVINLSPDKTSVYREAIRVLKPGGRLAISDVVTTAELPDEARGDLAQYAACVSGAASINELEDILAKAGFEDIRIRPKSGERDIPDTWKPGSNIGDYTVSATVQAVKPVN
jgi:SAM-dependent methyltransferase